MPACQLSFTPICLVATHLNNRWVKLTALLELLECQRVILVEVHVAEDLVHTLMLDCIHVRALPFPGCPRHLGA